MLRKVHSPEVRARLVKRYIAGEQVVSLAREIGVSVPGAYLWIKRAKEQAAEKARLEEMSPAHRTQENNIALAHENQALRSEVSRLQKKVLELVMRT